MLKSADPGEVNTRKDLDVCATNLHRGCYCIMR